MGGKRETGSNHPSLGRKWSASKGHKNRKAVGDLILVREAQKVTVKYEVFVRDAEVVDTDSLFGLTGQVIRVFACGYQ